MSYMVQINAGPGAHQWEDVEEFDTLADAQSDMRELARDEPDHDHRIVKLECISGALRERTNEGD